jgi:hypothetical protein
MVTITIGLLLMLCLLATRQVRAKVCCSDVRLLYLLVLDADDDPTAAAAAAARLENTLNYGMERIWAIGVMKGSNSVAFGFDEGVAVVKIGGCNKILIRHHLL